VTQKAWVQGYCFCSAGNRKGAGDGPYEVPKRLAYKIDSMTAEGLKAAHHLSPLIKARPDRVGMSLANRLGGWSFGEPEMVRLHESGEAQQVSVFLGTACFPAAVQGEISIAHRYLGHSKTFMGDGSAFLVAVDYALHLLRRDVLDQVLVGAFEAITSPWVLRQLRTTPLPASAVFLVLGREPVPTELGVVTVESRKSTRVPGTGFADTYPVQTAARLVGEIEQRNAAEEIALSLPGEPRQLVFRVE
jgi:hypothetical protein